MAKKSAKRIAKKATKPKGEQPEIEQVAAGSVPFDPIGAIVQARMRDRDLDVSKLARASRVNRAQLSYWLNGQRGIRSDRVARVLTVLNLAVVPADAYGVAPPSDGEHGAALIQTFVERFCHLTPEATIPVEEMEAAWLAFCVNVGLEVGPKGVVGRLLRENYGNQVRMADDRSGGKFQHVFAGIRLREGSEPKRKLSKR